MNVVVVGIRRGLRSIDRAVLAVIVLIVGIALALPTDAALQSLRFTTANLLSISPFLIFSALMAAYLTAAGADRMIGRVFSSRGVSAIFAAAVFGSLSPFCSCGVIPIIAALLAAGVPLPAVMAFWLSSPVMDPEMFILTVGGLGLEFAVAKTLAAFAIGTFGGLATRGMQNFGVFAMPLKENAFTASTCGGPIADEKPLWPFWRERTRMDAFRKNFNGTLFFLGKWLLLAFMLESLMVMYLPGESVAAWFGDDSPYALPLAVVAGVPAYMNGYAAIPLISGLLESGMGPGPALAFMTAGGVTSIPAAVAVFALVRRPVFLWYLLLAGTGSLAVGQSFQFYMSFN